MIFSRKMEVVPVRLETLENGDGCDLRDGTRCIKLGLHPGAEGHIDVPYNMIPCLREDGQLVAIRNETLVTPVAFRAHITKAVKKMENRD